MTNLNKIGFYTLTNDRVKNLSTTSQMSRCEMILTEYCNFKCPYCRGLKAEIYGSRPKKELSIEEIKRNIDWWCQDKPLKNIRFSGGEPTLHPHIVEAVAYAKSKGIERIAISTNGSSPWELYEKLILAGCNDFSVSLDGCCVEDVQKMSGQSKPIFNNIIENIVGVAALTYVTVGVVLTPDNIQKMIDTIRFADTLGISDIRIISAAQWNKPIEALKQIPAYFLKKYPILNYRVQNFIAGKNVRGMTEEDFPRCALVLDDSIIAGDYHFPCVIYMREKGEPIGKVSANMREERTRWFEQHNCYQDEICRQNCLDVCIEFNNTYRQYHPGVD